MASLISKSRDLLATPSHERLEILLTHLAMPQETIESQSVITLSNFCVLKFPNCLTQMLLKVYQSSSNEFSRSQSIFLLSQIIELFRICKTHLFVLALNEIKPLLISCLEMQETHMLVLRKIVSFVVSNGGTWIELSDCILCFAKTKPLKAFHMFIELPRVDLSFIVRFLRRILEEAEKVLVNHESSVEDWSLGLVTFVKVSIQFLDKRMDLVKTLFAILVKSMEELVKKDMEPFVIQGLENLWRFLLRDKDLYGYSKEQCDFVVAFMYKIKELGRAIKEVADKINRLVRS